MHQITKKKTIEPLWATSITRVASDRIEIAGYPLNEIIGRKSLPEVAHLLFTGRFPDLHQTLRHMEVLFDALRLPAPAIRPTQEDIAKTLVCSLLSDDALAGYPDEGPEGKCGKTLFCLGRTLRVLASRLGTEPALESADPEEPFSHLVYRVFTGHSRTNHRQAEMLDALVVATVDHGVTAPSAQASILAASVRASYEVAMAQGVSTLTPVHGGAGAGAADLFLDALRQAKENGWDLVEALQERMRAQMRKGKRIQGLGHRIHAHDPRCRPLWALAETTGTGAECVQCSTVLADVFERMRGIRLPVNVDGVIGAVVADMGLPCMLATAVFILGRLSGLSAHYFEEVAGFPPMRFVNFHEAVYQGHPTRPLPGC